jgi:nucleotide-binding universal stress UspA family protein
MHNNTTPMVLACIDGSKYSTAVCDYAAWISQRVRAPLKLLHNIDSRYAPPPSDLSGAIGLGSQEQLLSELTEVERQRSQLELEKGRLMLDAARERVVQAGVSDPVVKQRHGSLAESLIELEDEIRVLVLGIRGEEHAEDNKHLGAQLETVVRSLHRPILVVNREFTPPERIMLAYDGSDGARKALDMVAQSPLFKDIPCHLVHVGQNETDSEALLQEAARELAVAGQEVVTAQLSGKPGDALCHYQAEHKIDMTLMGAFSHTRLRELLLGSFTAKMLLAARQPLLLLR